MEAALGQLRAEVDANKKELDALTQQLNDKFPTVNRQIEDLSREVKDHIVAFGILETQVTALVGRTNDPLSQIPKLIEAATEANTSIDDIDLYANEFRQNMKEMSDKMQAADKEFAQHQTWSQTHVGTLISRVDVIEQSGGQGASSSFSETTFKRLDEHKAFEKFNKINAIESLGDLLEWFERFTIAMNSVLPGAYEVLMTVAV